MMSPTWSREPRPASARRGGSTFDDFTFLPTRRPEDTGLVRFGVRDYDAAGGRSIARDPSLFADGLNLYGYSQSDPINVIDVDGRSPALAVAAAVGVAAAVIVVSGAAIPSSYAFADRTDPVATATLIVGLGALVGEALGVVAAAAPGVITATCGTGAGAGRDHIVIGLRAFGLENTATQVGGGTLLNAPNWRTSLPRRSARRQRASQ